MELAKMWDLSRPKPAPPRETPDVDLEGLFCALVLVPTTFSRNRFYRLFESPAPRRVRRRAARVRGVVRQLGARGRAEVVGELVRGDGQVVLRYRVEELAFERTIALTALEAATLRFALARIAGGAPTSEDTTLVEQALRRLGKDLPRLELKAP